MSDVQTTNNPQDTQADSTLAVRRVVAFVISFALGLLVVVGLEPLVLKVPPFTASFPLAFLPEVPLWLVAGPTLGFFFLIWVDFFMGTRILPD